MSDAAPTESDQEENQPLDTEPVMSKSRAPEDDDDMSYEPTVGGAKQSVGDSLREAREAAGMTIPEVAYALKYSPRQIEALESDNYEALPGSTIVRGFTRSYAKLLGLDAHDLLHVLDRSAPNQFSNVRPPDNMGVASDHGQAKKGSLLTIILIVIVSLLVLAGGWYAKTRTTGNGDVNQETQDVTVKPTAEGTEVKQPTLSMLTPVIPMPADSSGSGVQPEATAPMAVGAADGATSVSAELSTSDKPVAEKPATDKPLAVKPTAETTKPEKPAAAGNKVTTGSQLLAPSLTILEAKVEKVAQSPQEAIKERLGEKTAEQAAVKATVKPVEDRSAKPASSNDSSVKPADSGAALEFEFADVVWLEIKDANQQRLFSGEKQAGSQLSVAGTPPYDLVIGNASAARLRYKGQQVELNAHSRANVARLKLE